MKIVIIGTGYVGLVTGCCFAEMGNHVTCIDIDEVKVQRLKNGESIIHEPGLDDLLASNVSQGRLEFSTMLEPALVEARVVFVAVGTPPKHNGGADLTAVDEAAAAIGKGIGHDIVLVTKSTVPVGTGDRVEEIIAEELQARGETFSVEVVSNPEFLKEGDAIEDFMKPDRIVIGSDSQAARELMTKLYKPFNRNHNKIMYMGRRDAEMTKYAANAMLATKISFMNEIANLCDFYDVDVENVRLGIGSDNRIGYSFIYPGVGYGGSCFPKDVRAAIHMGNQAGFDTMLLDAVELRNRKQKEYLFQRYVKAFGEESLHKASVAVWGLAFKPGTDDLREAPALELIKQLLECGARVKAYDPVAGENARKLLPAEWFEDDRLEILDNQYDVLDGARALFVMTEWKPFRRPDIAQLKDRMEDPRIFDGRNIYEPQFMRDSGFAYYGIGR